MVGMRVRIRFEKASAIPAHLPPGAGGPAGGLAEGEAIMRCAPPFVAPASGPGLPRFFEAREARADESAPAASPLTRTGQGL